MEVQVNLWAVLAAAISSLFVGAVWYSPLLFVKRWTKLARIDTKKTGGKSVWQPIAISFIVGLITAYVLAHVSFLSFRFFGLSFFQSAMTTAFWMWLGFGAARIITHDGFEGRPSLLTLITIGNEFVTYMLMGLLIGLIGI